MFGRGSSYSLRVITNWLDKKQMEYVFSSPRTGALCETGCLVKDLPGDFALSIQTHPLIAVDSFAETCLLYKGEIVYTHDWDYYDTRRYFSPEELFGHIEDLFQRLEDYTEYSDEGYVKGVRLIDGTEVGFINYHCHQT